MSLTWVARKLRRALVGDVPRQTCFVYCPKCRYELCAGGIYTGPEDECVETYECAVCGHHSRWLFDAPAPILLPEVTP